MPISKRTLTKWRKEALETLEYFKNVKAIITNVEVKYIQANRILLLTQELLDQQLMKEK